MYSGDRGDLGCARNMYNAETIHSLPRFTHIIDPPGEDRYYNPISPRGQVKRIAAKLEILRGRGLELLRLG